MSKVSYDLEAEATALQAKLAITDAGKVDLAEGAVDALLPEGLTIEDIVKAQDVIGKIVNVATLAGGRASIAGFKANKELTETEFKFKVGHDTVKINYTREGETSDGKGGRKTVYGQSRVAYLVSGGPSVGSLKKIRDTLKSEAASELAD